MNEIWNPINGYGHGYHYIAVFVWLYFEEKGKRDTMLEIAKHIDDPRQLEQLVSSLKRKRSRLTIDAAASSQYLLVSAYLCWVIYPSALSSRGLAHWSA